MQVAAYTYHPQIHACSQVCIGNSTWSRDGAERVARLVLYFYGESANAIKIQIWVTLIANLLLSLLQSSLERNWSFSGLATMVRIVLMYYLNLHTFFNQPDADLKIMLAEASEAPPADDGKE